METMHYFITNLQKFSGDTKAVEKLKKYLQDIEVVFPTIEDVYGQAWNDNQINIELDDSIRVRRIVWIETIPMLLKREYTIDQFKRKNTQKIYGAVCFMKLIMLL